jgi:rhodanese-related sulfurtransferase
MYHRLPLVLPIVTLMRATGKIERTSPPVHHLMVSNATNFAPLTDRVLMAGPQLPLLSTVPAGGADNDQGHKLYGLPGWVWINLWKLWIVAPLLPAPGLGVGRREALGRDRIGAMDDSAVPQLPVAQLPADFGEAAVLLDVREDDEWQRGHAPGAQHIPMGDVPARMDEIDPDKQLFVICHVGGRSLRVSQYLQRNGYEPVNVEGGMLAWAQAGRPVVTDTGTAGAV